MKIEIEIFFLYEFWKSFVYFFEKEYLLLPKRNGINFEIVCTSCSKVPVLSRVDVGGVGWGGLGGWRWGKSKIKTNSISRAGAGTEFVSWC